MNSAVNSELEARHAQIAEILVGERGILKATLGSCVGIVLMSREPARCGLAHCLLPRLEEEARCLDGRYASQAVENLLAAMGLEDRVEHPRRQLRAYLAGGARVVGELSREGRISIGEMNLRAARRALDEAGIVHEELETGGERGCVLMLDCTKQAVTCRRLRELEWNSPGAAARKKR